MSDINEIVSEIESLPVAKWKTVVLASLGSGFEIYDFIIYGVFAREIASQFFPSTDRTAALLSTFAVFALGYFVRPFSAVVMGSFGDRLGRRLIFLVSILSMSMATIGIGLIPNYAAIGILAPILLVTLRVIQGVFLAGELPCSITYVVEEMPERAGFVSGSVIFCLNIGVLIATLVSFIIHASLPQSAVDSYGWRIAFVIGGSLGLLSYWLRTSLAESEQFQLMRAHAAKRPVREVITKFYRRIAIGVGVAGLVNTCNTMLFVVLVPYFTGALGYDPVLVRGGQNMALAVMALTLITVAFASDRVPARYFQRFGAATIMLLSYPFFYAVSAREIGPITAFLVIGCATGFLNGTYAYLLADLFPTRIRFSGIALSLNLSATIFTALTPLIATLLLDKAGIIQSPGVVLSGVAVIAVIAGFCLKRSSGEIKGG